MSDAYTLWPGSDAAFAAGCSCPVMDNWRGDVECARARGGWWQMSDCPVHGQSPAPIPPEPGATLLPEATDDAH